ncbi:MAG TPA: response regulator [Candidatus Acidoferrales bacterium]|nr:response regulator [Candidatus Acidoferrales bacterium]
MVSVLVADDSTYMRDLLRRILEESGYNIIGEASNGDEAVDLYQKLRPDILLLDIVMDEGKTCKSGIDALKMIIADDPEAKIVVCSALDEHNLVTMSMKAGAKAFVAKPFEPEKLLETLVTCTDLRIFTEIGNIGAGHAATVLSKLAKQSIQISLPKLETGPPHLVARLVGAPDKVVTAVHMQLATEPGCDCLIMFDPVEAQKIAAIMTDYSTPVKPEVALSAVEEMGSIMICAFFSAIANFAELVIVPSKPDVVTDSFEAVIDVFLAKQLIVAKTALIFDMQFKRNESSANGYFLMIPSPEFRDQLIESGKKWVGPNPDLETEEVME